MMLQYVPYRSPLPRLNSRFSKAMCSLSGCSYLLLTSREFELLLIDLDSMSFMLRMLMESPSFVIESLSRESLKLLADFFRWKNFKERANKYGLVLRRAALLLGSSRSFLRGWFAGEMECSR